jgi:predicted nucleic acid-binding protein
MNGYLLDTNILSEIRKSRQTRAGKVSAWWETMKTEPVFLSVLVLGEVRKGIDLLSRRDPATALVLERWLKETREAFSGKILEVNLETALRWGMLSAIRPQPQVDGLLAATALTHDLTLVTRNIDDFRGVGLRVFNPFTGEQS